MVYYTQRYPTKESSVMKNKIVSGIIYGLHSGDGNIRYIGYTTMTPARRLTAHRCTARNNPQRRISKWMNKAGIESIQMEVLEQYTEISLDDLLDREIARIAEGYSEGLNLVNHTSGGEGGATRVGMKNSEAQKLAVSKALKGVPKSAEHRAKISACQKGRIPHNKGVKLSEDEIAIMKENFAKSAGKGGHTRYHTNRNIIKEGCKYCG